LHRSMNLRRTVARRGKVHAARSDAQILQVPELADPLGKRLQWGRIRAPARRRGYRARGCPTHASTPA
jgi:hypothetical protein